MPGIERQTKNPTLEEKISWGPGRRGRLPPLAEPCPPWARDPLTRRTRPRDQWTFFFRREAWPARQLASDPTIWLQPEPQLGPNLDARCKGE